MVAPAHLEHLWHGRQTRWWRRDLAGAARPAASHQCLRGSTVRPRTYGRRCAIPPDLPRSPLPRPSLTLARMVEGGNIMIEVSEVGVNERSADLEPSSSRDDMGNGGKVGGRALGKGGARPLHLQVRHLGVSPLFRVLPRASLTFDRARSGSSLCSDRPPDDRAHQADGEGAQSHR